jgi:hypothetical protein
MYCDAGQYLGLFQDESAAAAELENAGLPDGLFSNQKSQLG